MPVETASFISQLNNALPDGTDSKAEGDNHLRLIKAVLQGQFTSLGANAVTVSAAEINSVTTRGLKAGDTYTGTHGFTGAVVNVATAPANTNSTLAASTAFATAAVSTALTANTAAFDASLALAQAAADSAAALVGAPRWISASTYALGALAWSPLDQRIYRRIVAGGGTTDPSLDATNWQPVAVDPNATISAELLYFSLL